MQVVRQYHKETWDRTKTYLGRHTALVAPHGGHVNAVKMHPPVQSLLSSLLVTQSFARSDL